jgi:hypothetical protein
MTIWLRRKVKVALLHCGTTKGWEDRRMEGDMWLPGTWLCQMDP